MPDIIQQIQELEEELKKTKYNKATQFHIGLTKAKLAKLREQVIAKASGGKKGEGFTVKKSGDASVVLVGFPSVGKSTLLNALTNAKSKIGSYEFTTLDVIPGTLHYNHATIQILDVPGIVHGAASGRGRGKEVIAVMRSADLCLFVIEVQHPAHLKALQKELFDAGLRLNQKRPDVKIKKKSRGGISIHSTVKLKKVDIGVIKKILQEYRLSNADAVIREDIDIDQLIDVLETNRTYIPSIIVLNKIDLVSGEKKEQILKAVKPDLCVSAEKRQGIEELKELIFRRLELIRIYCKEVGKPADLNVPLIMRSGTVIKDMGAKLHRDFINKFKFARVWGSSKFPGQKLSLGYELKDKDIVEIHMN